MSPQTKSFPLEARWPVMVTVFSVLFVMGVLPGHVHTLPLHWFSFLFGFALITPMAGVALTSGSLTWLRIERSIIILFSIVAVGHTVVELTDMIGVVTIHPTGNNAFSLLSSAVAIWLLNVLSFSLLYWQIDGRGLNGQITKPSTKRDWIFPQSESPEQSSSEWEPSFVDYLFLGYNTATAFSPTDALPVTHRAKLLMLTESTISLLTMVIVVSRAINVIPS